MDFFKTVAPQRQRPTILKTDTNPHDIIWWTALQTARDAVAASRVALPTRGAVAPLTAI